MHSLCSIIFPSRLLSHFTYLIPPPFLLSEVLFSFLSFGQKKGWSLSSQSKGQEVLHGVLEGKGPA